MIRQAVGAIIYSNDRVLLVEKVKQMDTLSGRPHPIESEWDIPKGGVLPTDQDLNAALLRELEEETGSTEFRVIKEFEERIFFHFSKEISERNGFLGQETVIFEVEYIGQNETFTPQTGEINQVKLFSLNDALDRVTHEETRHYLIKHLR